MYHFLKKTFFTYPLSYLVYLLSRSAGSIQISPTAATLAPKGIKSQQVHLLTNTSSEPATVQFKITTRKQREDGSEIRNPASQLFSIHPKQVVIAPGGIQKVRVKWLGGNQHASEKAFRFIA